MTTPSEFSYEQSPAPSQGPEDGSAPEAAGDRGLRASLARHELEALQRREPEALEKFYQLFFDRIYGYVRRLLNDDHLAEDVTQDVFLQIHRALPTYDPGRPLQPWVFTIATNKVRDLWGSRSYQAERSARSRDDEGLDSVVREASAEDGPLESLQRLELRAALARALDEVPETMRSTLWLRAYEGLSFRDIAELFERSEVAVRKRYSRGLRELRERLERLLETDQDPH